MGPIFVVGNSRSGTHLMSRILGKHSAVFAFQELHFFGYLWSPTSPPRVLSTEQALKLAARLLTVQRDGYFTQGDPRRYVREAQAIVEGREAELTAFHVFQLFLDYEAWRHGKSIPCDHTPRNLFYLREILDFYPEARVVNMVRDPRDVLLSQKKRWRRRSLGAHQIPRREAVRAWINYHPITISMLWNSAIWAGDVFADHPRVIQVRFEDLVSSPQEVIREVCAFLDLEFQEEMLRVPQIGSSHRLDTPSRIGVDVKAVGRWRKGGLNRAELFVCQRITAKNMQLHGYEPAGVHLLFFPLIYYAVTWLFKSGLALLFNVSRYHSISSSLKRRFQLEEAI